MTKRKTKNIATWCIIGIITAMIILSLIPFTIFQTKAEEEKRNIIVNPDYNLTGAFITAEGYLKYTNTTNTDQYLLLSIVIDKFVNNLETLLFVKYNNENSFSDIHYYEVNSSTPIYTKNPILFKEYEKGSYQINKEVREINLENVIKPNDTITLYIGSFYVTTETENYGYYYPNNIEIINNIYNTGKEEGYKEGLEEKLPDQKIMNLGNSTDQDGGLVLAATAVQALTENINAQYLGGSGAGVTLSKSKDQNLLNGVNICIDPNYWGIYQNKEYYLKWTSFENVKEINVGFTAVANISSNEITNIENTKFFKISTIDINNPLNTPFIYQENIWYPWGPCIESSKENGPFTMCINIIPIDNTKNITITGMELWVKNPNSNLYDTAYKDGYQKGETNGYNQGYINGYNKATNESNNLSSMLVSIAEVPFGVIKSMFNFELLGVNIANLVMSILTACLCIVVIKLLV